MGLGSLGQDCLNRCAIKLSLLKHENKWPGGGLLSTQQLPQSTRSLLFSYHRPFVMISTTKAEICTRSAAAFHSHSSTHWPRSSAVEETQEAIVLQAALRSSHGLELIAESWGQTSSSCPHAQVCPLCSWEGTSIGLPVLPWEMPGGGIVRYTFLNLLYIFYWLRCAKAQDGLNILPALRGCPGSR